VLPPGAGQVCGLMGVKWDLGDFPAGKSVAGTARQ
jgi:hypothetical protein